MISTSQPIKNKLFTHSCRHIAIIMDGNGRWAEKQGRIRTFGHIAGVKTACRTVSFAINYGIDVLTLYAFSSENWNRPIQEVQSLMEIFMWALSNEVKNLHRYNVRLHVIGDIYRFNTNLQKCIHDAEVMTRKNTGLELNIAANYSGRWDIIQSVQHLALQVKEGLLKPDQINEDLFNKFICMNNLSPVDLVIRTGGEYRISNFLLWQIAYSELYFTDVLWPDFNEQIFKDALYAFANRERRFGNVNLCNKNSNEM